MRLITTNDRLSDPADLRPRRLAPLGVQPDQHSDAANFQRPRRKRKKIIEGGEILRGDVRRPNDSDGGDEASEPGFCPNAH
jgi:hypothetical protein